VALVHGDGGRLSESIAEKGRHRMRRVLVVGGSGLLGRPVVDAFLSAGDRVRVLSRNPAETNARLRGSGVAAEVLGGTVTDADSVERAVRGCSHVHVSLGGGSDAAGLERVEGGGTALVAAAAARQGVQLLSYVSGSLVHVDYGPKTAEHRAKLRAERAILDSGVPHVILRPTYVMDTLPRHVQGPFAMVIGHPPPLHMVAAADLATMVVRAHHLPDVSDLDVHVHGPEPLTIADALRTYCSLVEPGKRVVVVPRRLMSAADRVVLRGRLRPALEVMALLERFGEQGDPSEADALLGRPTTTLTEWCKAVVR
jgi:uncharacterized protein YbjT (DUF2867 family)